LVVKGHDLMFDAAVVSPVVEETDVVGEEEGLVSDGEPLSVVVALFEPPATPVGAGVAVAMPT
jgi:hypothetical protein